MEKALIVLFIIVASIVLWIAFSATDLDNNGSIDSNSVKQERTE